MNQTIASTILSFMGSSRRFEAAPVAVADGVMFHCKGRTLGGINAVRVTVDTDGEYTVRFLSGRRANPATVCETQGVRASQLRETLEYYTGL